MGAGIKKQVVKSKNEYKNKKPTTRVGMELERCLWVKICGSWVFACGEDTHSLRLKSELFDLRSGYANQQHLLFASA